MESNEKTLVTGGSGLLGGELRRLLKGADFPDRSVFDITDFSMMQTYLRGKSFERLVHAAAFTSPPRIDKDPAQALDTNVVGTANVVRLCMQSGMRLIYISTDYVFKGDTGNYSEEDPVFPVNKYAWSKLGGECAVRLHENSLVIRTSFGPNVFPYEKAFVDQWTSRESVSVVAEKISKLAHSHITGTIHVGGLRRTVMEYALSLDQKKGIASASIHDMPFKAPRDTSLNVSKYKELFDKQG